MNLPNKLSILRVLCVPAITALLCFSPAWCRWAAFALFILGSLTDYLDGHLARKNNWITDFGKFIDPVADKLLVLSTLIMLSERGLFPAWMNVLLLTRELSVDGLRLIAGTKGHVIAAGPLGKIKTFSQMIFVLFLMITWQPAFSTWYGTVFALWIAGITLFSGIDYFRRNLDVFRE